MKLINLIPVLFALPFTVAATGGDCSYSTPSSEATSQALTVEWDPSIAGCGEAAVYIDVSVADEHVATTTAPCWDGIASMPLADGDYTVSMTLGDAAIATERVTVDGADAFVRVAR